MITLLYLKALAKKAIVYVKKYWKLIIGIIVMGVIYFTSRSKVSSLAKTIENINESHKQEIDAIDNTRLKEIEDIEKAEVRMRSALAKVEEAYEESEKLLDEKKKKQIKKVLKENKKDPDAITKRLAEITGFEIHVD